MSGCAIHGSASRYFSIPSHHSPLIPRIAKGEAADAGIAAVTSIIIAMRIRPIVLLITLPFLCAAEPATTTTTATAPTFNRTQDIVYGRSYGTALTLDVFRPSEKANGAGVIIVVSGGWVSAHELIGSAFFGA